MEQIALSDITCNIQGRQVTSLSQHGFTKGSSSLSNLNSLYDKATCVVDEGKIAGAAYLDLRKAFDTVFHSILLKELAAHGFSGHTLC